MKTQEQKRMEAEQRQRQHDMRTVQEQLDVINKRRGSSKKEKQRLLDKLLKLQKDFHSHGKSQP